VGGTEFTIGFEGSKALPVCPSGNCKLLTGTIEVLIFFLLALVGGGGYVRRKFLKLPLGGRHVKHTEQKKFTEHELVSTGSEHRRLWCGWEGGRGLSWRTGR
jgi:hypothetical protein